MIFEIFLEDDSINDKMRKKRKFVPENQRIDVGLKVIYSYSKRLVDKIHIDVTFDFRATKIKKTADPKSRTSDTCVCFQLRSTSGQ